jgi:hypothetical protein
VPLLRTIPSSRRSDWIQHRSTVLVARARYFASAFDRAIVGCFLEHQVIRLRPIKTQLPVVDPQSSLEPAQSASEYVVRLRLIVPLTYRRTYLTASKCIVVGCCMNKET